MKTPHERRYSVNDAQQVLARTRSSTQLPITVYVRRGSAPCASVLRDLDASGLDYEEVDLAEKPAGMATVKALGHFLPPVVVAGPFHWSGNFSLILARLVG